MKRTGILLVVLLCLLGVAPREGGTAPEVITDVGSFVTDIVRVATTVSDCGDADPATEIQFVTRNGTVVFTGAIAGAGQLSSNSLRDACSSPPAGTVQAQMQLQGATVGGVTGDLLIELEGVFDGDPTLPGGVRVRLHGTITGVSGGLRNARGRIQAAGPVTATGSLNAYYVEIRVK